LQSFNNAVLQHDIKSITFIVHFHIETQIRNWLICNK